MRSIKMDDKQFLEMERDFYSIYSEDQLAEHYKRTSASRLELFKYFELRKIRIALEKLASK